MKEETLEGAQALGAMLGELDVALGDGSHVIVRPWGVRSGRRMMVRIKTMLMLATSASSGNLDLGKLIDGSYDEMAGVVGDTIGWSLEKVLDEMLLEDFIALLEAIIRINFVERPGLVKNLLSLVSTVETFVPERGADPEPEPSPTP